MRARPSRSLSTSMPPTIRCTGISSISVQEGQPQKFVVSTAHDLGGAVPVEIEEELERNVCVTSDLPPLAMPEGRLAAPLLPLSGALSLCSSYSSDSDASSKEVADTAIVISTSGYETTALPSH